MNQNKPYKKWIIVFFTTIVIGSLPIAIFNYYVDPLWLFHTSNSTNQNQDGFDERQQKTNWISYHSFSYDSLLLGSSRSTYINQEDFGKEDVFNYSVSSMLPQEYGPYIAYAKKQRGKAFRTIYLGLDFFGTSKNMKAEFKKPEFYFSNASDPFYRMKMLLNFDTMERSKYNLKLANGEAKTKAVYNRKLVKEPTRLAQFQANKSLHKDLETYRNDIYGDSYTYRSNYKSLLSKLKKENPNSKFVVFTTPVSKPLYDVMITSNRFPDYERWLRDLVDVFGGVHHFMYPNSVTENQANYFDAHHFYPKTGTLIIDKVTGKTDKDKPSDFGVYLTKRNINIFIKEWNPKNTSQD
ncbi:hypothetical protein IHV12_04130 [Fictibacillus sp. 7GRE50]|uniref:hypothetical protein n=1 Tax=Fictibacillus sp. 7GRE50 TaxID=2745878 RepID=UPI0018CCD297|nr:hypothetical protein [Fictibacillus sp. 7GRE50]MBH0164088.1 hypothetical protein [Fictibacillus sp. 7GRE50]